LVFLAQVTVTFTRACGTEDDGYADDIGMTLGS
jgi:hypothetical protein